MSMFTAAVVEQIRDRDNDRCAWCGDPIRGVRGVDWSVHHRVPRSMGGTSRAWVGRAANGVLLHGSGTTGCHGMVERFRDQARSDGFLVSANGTEPASHVPIIHAVHGRVVLLDDDPWIAEAF